MYWINILCDCLCVRNCLINTKCRATVQLLACSNIAEQRLLLVVKTWRQCSPPISLPFMFR